MPRKPRTAYNKGADKEQRIVRWLRKRGWVAVRSAGSHSIVDVWAVNPDTMEIKLIQSKMGHLSKKEEDLIRSEGKQLDGYYKVTFELWQQYNRDMTSLDPGLA